MKTKTIMQFLTLAFFVNVGLTSAQTLNKKIDSNFKKFESKTSIIDDAEKVKLKQLALVISNGIGKNTISQIALVNSGNSEIGLLSEVWLKTALLKENINNLSVISVSLENDIPSKKEIEHLKKYGFEIEHSFKINEEKNNKIDLFTIDNGIKKEIFFKLKIDLSESSFAKSVALLIDKKSEKNKVEIKDSVLVTEFNIVPDYEEFNRKKVIEIIAVKMIFLVNQIKNLKNN